MAEHIHELFYKYVSRCIGSKFVDFILNNFLVKSFYSKRGWVIVTLVSKDLTNFLTNISDAKVIGFGLLCGWIYNEKFIPSPHLFNLSKRYSYSHGCSVVAKPQGVKAFLYGKDLLLASLDYFIPPIKKGDHIAVLDSSDMYAIGTGMLLVDEDDIKRLIEEGKMLTAIVKNVFDLGIHIRNEKFFLP